jgi:hypothetical protein
MDAEAEAEAEVAEAAQANEETAAREGPPAH